MRQHVIVIVVFSISSVLANAVAHSQFVVGADQFDRGNVRTSQVGVSYANLHSCIWDGGEYPNYVDYDIDFPVEATYSFFVLYTAADSRPVEILLDGKLIHTGLATVTGSWQTDHAQWEKQCTMPISMGKHTITLRCQECLPHICALRMESLVPFPPNWKLRRPGLEERRRREARRKTASGLLRQQLILAQCYVLYATTSWRTKQGCHDCQRPSWCSSHGRIGDP